MRGVARTGLDRAVGPAMSLQRGVVWGGANGALFLVPVVSFLALRFPSADLYLFGFLSLAVAFVVGALVGSLYAALDGAMLVTARRVVRACRSR
ncbi:MAG: hypothetical protein HY332_25530 [Chloroflexi bacterium]|nr:hypothetical protein [Chloroflexota bacterium]